MMRSLFSGVSGLKVHQTKMDVIANNISNINTTGFKRASVNFCDVFNQTLSGATGPNDNTGKGGTNAMQVGLGSNVASIQNIMTTGSVQRTDNGDDVMIDGQGFFIVNDNSGYYFTRAGAFQVDKSGNLIDSNGLKVCGWEAVEDPDNPGTQMVQKGKVNPINLYSGEKSYISPQTTSRIDFEGNINANDGEQTNTIAFYDSLGNRYVVDANLKYDTTSRSWAVSFGNKATVNGDTKNPIDMTGFDKTITLSFEDGKPTGTEADLRLELSVDFAGEAPYNTTFAEPIVVDFSGLTQYTSSSDATAVTKDGYAAGSLKGYSIGTDGKIVGNYTNGMTKILGQIAVADFKNPAGLEKVGNNLYQTTVNSGDFDGIGQEVGASGGTLMGGSLEMSNVDLSYEFTQMITTQRGFQANSRVITTSDDMLQELISLKR